MRQVVLDTETTGIGEGHKIIEIGCIELIDRKFTGRQYHQYVNPQRLVDPEAMEVHGISDEFLQDKPLFANIANDFIDFISGGQLVIHNAPFDVGFMDREFGQLSGYPKTADICTILDTLVLARKMHPGQRNSLDALCRRYGIDNSHRELHGALLDSEILADVYLLMTGGQTNLILDSAASSQGKEGVVASAVKIDAAMASQLKAWGVSEIEQKEHDSVLELLTNKSEGPLWSK
ncbi:DNA polymerase III subunit epsilon [Bermanella sp. 47_1433_sub80_T6]|nr:DNA polymerase III subunit epsilon [Bermanella sp. 47_1433_sub80_T6]